VEEYETPAMLGVRATIVKKIDEVLDQLVGLTQIMGAASIHGGIGHNQPPDAFPLSVEDQREVISVLTSIRNYLTSGQINHNEIVRFSNKLEEPAAKIITWIAPRVNLAADEFAKQIGKSLADGRLWIASWLVISGNITKVVELLANLVR
jgi:hypothetical protein